MSDKLKIFVQKHRAEMDTQLPSAKVWNTLSKQLPGNPYFISNLLQKGTLKLVLAACTIPVAIGIFYFAKKETTPQIHIQANNVNVEANNEIDLVSSNSEKINPSEINKTIKYDSTQNNNINNLTLSNNQETGLTYYNHDRLSGKNGGIDFYQTPKQKPVRQQSTGNTNEKGIPTATHSITHLKCKGDKSGKINITPEGNAPFTYSWSIENRTSQNIGGLSAGTYSLTITDVQGKTSVFNYEVTEPSGLSISLSTTPAHCNKKDGTVTVDAKKLKSESYFYNWSNGDTEASLTNLPAGVYIVTVTDNKGCTTTASATIESKSNVSLVFSVAPSAPLKIDFTNNSSTLSDNASGAVLWKWEFGDGTTEFNLNPSHTYAHSGTYRTCLIAQNSGCRDSICNTIEVSNDVFVNIPNVFTPNGDGVNDNFVTSCKGMQKVEMTILDKQGTKVCDLSGLSPAWDGKTNTGKDAAIGTYYYFIKAYGNDNKTYDYKGFLLLNR